MTVTIDVTARIERVRLENLSGTFAGDPSANYSWLYTTSGSSPHGGLYLEKEGGAIIGPFITGTVATNWQTVFHPRENEPPSSIYATLDTVNSRPVLDFTAGESSVFSDVMHPDYSNGGLNLRIGWSATGSSGIAYYQVAMERIVTGTTDLDTDDFASAVNGSSANVAGHTLGLATLSLSNGSQMDSAVAGDDFRMKFTFVSGTFVEDFELHFIEIQEQ